jgi:hypothetical protein
VHAFGLDISRKKDSKWIWLQIVSL